MDERDAKIEVLERRIKRLEAENLDLLRRVHGDVGFRAIGADGNVPLDFSGMPGGREVIAMFASAFAETLGDAPNYATIRVHHPDKGWLEVTVQRADKLTPADGRRRAERECLKMLEFIQSAGLNYELPFEINPEHCKEGDDVASKVDTDWIVIDYRQKPNVMRCLRCGGSEPIPDPVGIWVMQAMQAKFDEFHTQCEELKQ